MKKYLENGLEYGGTYQVKTAAFKPVADFKIVIEEFERMYNFHDEEIQPLFNIHEQDDTIVLIVNNTYMFSFKNEDIYIDDEDIYGNDCEGLKNHLKNDNISELTSDILCKMTIDEEFSPCTIVEKIALPGQVIKIQLTDLTYGNSEFNMTT